MNKNNLKKIIMIFLLVILFLCQSIFSQETETAVPIEGEIPEENILENEISEEKIPLEKGRFHLFLNNNLIFILAIENGAFGFGETVTFEYTTPFGLSFGVEGGYYGAKSEPRDKDNPLVAGFSMLPMYAIVEMDIKILDNLFITPVVKVGVSYTNVRFCGWYGGSAFSPMFEGGLRLKAILGGGLLIQGNIIYGGLIEKSGIISIMNIGLGFGL